MDYVKTYRRFIYGHYLATGVRITAGIVLPAVILNHFNLLTIGMVLSLGALCVSTVDNPGPIGHRRNSMLICSLLIFVIAFLTGIVQPYPAILGIFILVCCFLFSIISVYGINASNIGLAVLLVMVLNSDEYYKGRELLMHSFYILAGGIWYTLLSLVLYNFRPYKLAQQALGDCIFSTADYLRIRADFYSTQKDEIKVYEELREEQIALHEKQQLVRELLFRSRDIVKSPTPIGRTLIIMFIDIVDIYERAMASYYDYEALHKAFEETGILNRYQDLIFQLSYELDDIGFAVQGGHTSHDSGHLQAQIKEVRSELAGLRDKKRTPENLAAFIQLRHILQGIEDVASRIQRLRLYTAYDKKLVESTDTSAEYDQFVTKQSWDIRLLLENLTLKSNTFRHSLRVSIAAIVGYIVSLFLALGHGYWIMMTIIVILKPNYSLTKKRNWERLLGTVAGAAVAVGLLYFIKDTTALFVIMLFLMIGTYTLLRINYMIGVLLMTPYILLLFHLLYSANVKVTLTDRVLDTAIASGIAFLANIFLVPAWEQDQMKSYMLQMLEDNLCYFKNVAAAFTGKPVNITAFKLSRKNAFVALANLSDAFSRMLMEPKRKQKNVRHLQQFVALNQTLSSHIAALSQYTEPLAVRYASEEFVPVINYISTQLEEAKSLLNNKPVPADTGSSTPFSRGKLEKRVEALLEKRRTELLHGLTETETRKTLSELKAIVDQFNFIAGVAADIKKINS